MFVWFIPNWIFYVFSLTFVMRRYGYMIASVLDQKNSIPTSFVFLLRKSAFAIGSAFFCISTKNVSAFFCRISAGITAFLRKIAAVNLNSQ